MIKVVRAIMECDACGKQFNVDFDTASEFEGPIFKHVENAFYNDIDISTVDDLQLCPDCTSVADNIGEEDHTPTREEVLRAVGAIS